MVEVNAVFLFLLIKCVYNEENAVFLFLGHKKITLVST